MMKYAVLIYSDERLWEKMTEAEQMASAIRIDTSFGSILCISSASP
jgi:hypothetical protein